MFIWQYHCYEENKLGKILSLNEREKLCLNYLDKLSQKFSENY